MRTEQSNHDDLRHIRKVKKYGDSSIYRSCYNAEFLKMIWEKKKGAYGFLLFNVIQLIIGALAYSQNAVFRRKFGFQTTGMALSFIALSVSIVWNSALLPGFFKPLFVPATPLFLVFKDWDTLWRYLTVEITSLSLLIYSAGLLVFSVVHVAMIYFKKGNDSPTKRGESWIYSLVSKRLKVNEYLICGVVEPGIMMLIGLWYWTYTRDHSFAIYLWCCAGAVAVQQLADVSEQAQRRAILNI